MIAQKPLQSTNASEGIVSIPYEEICAHVRLIIPHVSAVGNLPPEVAYAAGFKECQEKILHWIRGNFGSQN